jgi:hypothetical protein
MRSGSQYLLWFATITAIAGGVVAGVNLGVDPYGIHRPNTVQSRPRIRDLERMHKAHAIADANAEALLLGNSRVIVGLDPHHPALPATTYNLAISASNIYETLRYFQHAAALCSPRLVILGIDPGMFEGDSLPEVDFSEGRLAVTRDGRPQPGWARTDLAPTILSASAFVDSARTLAWRGPSIRYPDGMRDEALMTPYRTTRKLLAENERWKSRSREIRLGDRNGRAPQVEAFGELLRACRTNGARLVIFTNPVHAELLDLMRMKPGAYEDWMTRVVAAIDAEYPAAELWDFCGYNEITCEPFPGPDEPVSKMRWYWEISHYRREVGDLVLDALFSRPEARPGFGRRVTRETLAENFERLNRERASTRFAAISK